MSGILEYKCPNCGGAISFDAGRQKMKCPYCDTEFDVESLKEYDEAIKQDGNPDISWDPYTKDSGSGDWTQGEVDGMRSYVCEACGGEIVGDESMGATCCPYCGNPVVVAKQFSGMLKPDYVIPFKLDKKAAKEALSGFLKGKHLLPRFFKDENRIDSITGLYVPYWLFNCNTDANMRFNATRVTNWSDSTYNYHRTDYFMLLRAGNMDFERVPVDGSSKVDNRYTEAVEPFDYSQAVDFQTAYLAGYLADKYDVDAQDCVPRANQRIQESVVQAFSSTTMGYITCVPAATNINLKQGDIRYALLPLWILNTKYRDKIYTFAMNGQTGKFVGELPVDWKKFWLWFGGVFAAAGALFSAIAFWLF